ncbi:MAG: DUF3999 family protein [Candidatus Taylorbacteria bacterium]|nr:DUF3999 family protein [Candidatus Taylorbacteria bacterium]
MNKKIITSASILGIFAFATYAFADFKPTDWQFKKAVAVPSVSVAGYVQATLDKDIYAKSNLEDLRVVDALGLEVPYQLVVKNSSGNDQYYSSNLLDLSTSGGKTSFTLDLGSRGIIHDRISIGFSSENFRRQVSVFASDKNGNWQLLTDKGYVYNFTDNQANFSAGKGEVNYPKSTARYIHVVIGNGEGNEVSVSSAQVYRYDVRQAVEEGVTVSVSAVLNSVEKSTELTADLGSPIPTHSLTLTSSDSNFNRRVVIQASQDKKTWRLTGQGYIFKVNTSLFSGSELTINYPETSSRYVRVIVFNQDNQPLAFGQTALLKSVARNIIWEAKPGILYSIYYGNSYAQAPHYDLDRIFQYIESENISQVSLSGEKTMLNDAYVAPAGRVVPFTEKYPYVLNIVLVVLVVIILIFLFFYARKAYGVKK